MDNPDLTQLSLEVSAMDATDQELDCTTRPWLARLRATDVESAKLRKGGPNPKIPTGGPITLGSIAIEVLPAAIPAVITLEQAWMARGQGHAVKFKGKGIEFEGSPEEFRKLLATLESGKKKK